MLPFALTLALATAHAAEPDGGKLYTDFCSVCHGDRGDGKSWVRELNPPPRDFTTREAAATVSRERMLDAVRNGRPGTAMAAWGKRLSNAEIEAVVDHVRTEFMPHDAAHTERAQASYRRHCAPCHGADGTGSTWAKTELNPPPADLTAGAALSRERKILSVTLGRPQTAMAGWGKRLSTEEIGELVDWIGDTFEGAAQRPVAPVIPGHPTMAGHPPMPGHPPIPDGAPRVVTRPTPVVDRAAPMPHGLVGDADRGRVLYMNNCVACHGAAGEGNGPRAYFVFPKPRDFTSPAVAGGFDRPRFYTAIYLGSIGSEMPAWRWVLEPAQIADIAEYLFVEHVERGE